MTGSNKTINYLKIITDSLSLLFITTQHFRQRKLGILRVSGCEQTAEQGPAETAQQETRNVPPSNPRALPALLQGPFEAFSTPDPTRQHHCPPTPATPWCSVAARASVTHHRSTSHMAAHQSSLHIHCDSAFHCTLRSSRSSTCCNPMASSAFQFEVFETRRLPKRCVKSEPPNLGQTSLLLLLDKGKTVEKRIHRLKVASRGK